MKKIELEERKKLQLDILDEIHRFCLENKINYSLGYGTLLGAVRHKGYIPWDDDIDIVMLRKDYDRFISTFSTSIYKVASATTIDNWFLPFAKVYDNRTLIMDRKANTTSIGLNVDVFPVDEISEIDYKYVIQKTYIKFLSYCNAIKLFKLNRETKLHKNIVMFVLKILLILFPKFFFLQQIIKKSQLYNGTGSKKVFCWASIDDKYFLHKDVYEDLCEMEFENKLYMAIKKYHIYLSSMYGDYMALPPEEKRISFHTSDAYWK